MKKIELWFTAFLPIVDLIGLLISFSIAQNLRTTLDILPIDESRASQAHPAFLLWYFPLLLLLFSYHRLYILHETRGRVQQLFRIVSASATASMIEFMITLFGRTPFVAERYPAWFNWANNMSLLTIFYFWLITIVVITALRWLYRSFFNGLLKQGVGKRMLLLIGNAPMARSLAVELERDPTLGYHLLGLVRTHSQRRVAEAEYTHHPHFLGDLKDVQSIIRQQKPDRIIQADPDMDSESILEIIDVANDIHADFVFAPNLFEVLATNVSVSNIAGIPLLELRRTPLDGWGKILKRAVDVLLGLCLIVLLSPVFLIAALLIILQDGFPVLYLDERISLGKPFKMLKFRSMIKDAKKLEQELRRKANERHDGPLFKLKNDPRITPLGRFLRKSRIDELPQLFNVLKGEMSLVGPRPHNAYEIAQYQKHHRKVLAIKPGLSGPAQLSGSSDLTFEEEVSLDTYYIENWSLLKDLELLIKTPFVVIFKDKSGA